MTRSECVCWQVNDRVGVKRGADGSMHVYINGDDMGVAASNIPKVGNYLSSGNFRQCRSLLGVVPQHEVIVGMYFHAITQHKNGVCENWRLQNDNIDGL